LGLGAVTSVED